MTDCIRRRTSYWTHCECDRCDPERKRRKKLHSVGKYERVSSEEAWAVLAAKIDAGWTARAIGSATRLDAPDVKDGFLYFSRHVAYYRRGVKVGMGPNVARAVVNMGTPTAGQVGAEPSRRRLRALAAIGHGLRSLAAETGIGFSTLAMVRSRNERVAASIANVIAEAYERLNMTPGDDDQAVREARLKGWPSPLAYDDIDDLTEQPEHTYTPPTRAEIVADLDERGAGINEVCRVLDISRDTLERWLVRRGEWETYKRLRSRDDTEYRDSWGAA